MSYPCPENPDGTFLTSDGGDEVDFSRAAVNVVYLSDIPPVFVDKAGVKKCLPGERLSLIKSSWGTRMSEFSEPTSGVLALVTFKGENLKEEKAKAGIDKILGARKYRFLRWADKEVLLSFKDMAGYKAFGDKFIAGEFDSIGSGILQIKGASFINTPQCFLEILSPADEGRNTQDALNMVVSSFSGAFTHCTILETKDLKPQGEFMTKVLHGSVPSVAVTLMFAVQAQSLAAKTKTILSASPWRQVTLPAPLQEEIGFDTDFFVHTELALPLIGLKTGAPSSGVQITRLVQKKENFDEMVKFYQTKVDTHPVGGSKSSAAGVLKAKFAISRYSELVISFLPGLSCESVSTARMCFLDKSSEGGKVDMSQDKERNQVLSISCYK